MKFVESGLVGNKAGCVISRLPLGACDAIANRRYFVQFDLHKLYQQGKSTERYRRNCTGLSQLLYYLQIQQTSELNITGMLPANISAMFS